MTDTVTIQQFIQEQRISMTAQVVDSNPNMQDSANMDHWKVVLVRPAHKLTTYFSMGYGHHGAEPTAADVLNSLAWDASTIENASDFEDFCEEFGYDTDSRSAEKTYKACFHSAKRLRAFLGDSLDTLMWDVERL